MFSLLVATVTKCQFDWHENTDHQQNKSDENVPDDFKAIVLVDQASLSFLRSRVYVVEHLKSRIALFFFVVIILSLTLSFLSVELIIIFGLVERIGGRSWNRFTFFRFDAVRILFTLQFLLVRSCNSYTFSFYGFNLIVHLQSICQFVQISAYWICLFEVIFCRFLSKWDVEITTTQFLLRQIYVKVILQRNNR